MRRDLVISALGLLLVCAGCVPGAVGSVEDQVEVLLQDYERQVELEQLEEDLSEALAMLQDAEADDTSEERAWQLVGSGYVAARAFEPAVYAFARSAALDPERSLVLNNLGFLMLRVQDLDAAAVFLDAADPEHGATLQNQGMLRWHQGDVDAALPYFEAAAEASAHPHHGYSLAQAQVAQGMTEDAVETLTVVLAEFPGDADSNDLYTELTGEVWDAGEIHELAGLVFDRLEAYVATVDDYALRSTEIAVILEEGGPVSSESIGGATYTTVDVLTEWIEDSLTDMDDPAKTPRSTYRDVALNSIFGVNKSMTMGFAHLYEDHYVYVTTPELTGDSRYFRDSSLAFNWGRSPLTEPYVDLIEAEAAAQEDYVACVGDGVDPSLCATARCQALQPHVLEFVQETPGLLTAFPPVYGEVLTGYQEAMVAEWEIGQEIAAPILPRFYTLGYADFYYDEAQTHLDQFVDAYGGGLGRATGEWEDFAALMSAYVDSPPVDPDLCDISGSVVEEPLTLDEALAALFEAWEAAAADGVPNTVNIALGPAAFLSIKSTGTIELTVGQGLQGRVYLDVLDGSFGGGAGIGGGNGTVGGGGFILWDSQAGLTAAVSVSAGTGVSAGYNQTWAFSDRM